MVNQEDIDIVKQYYLFNHVTKTLLSNRKNGMIVEVEMEVDTFNSHIYYNVTDGMDIIYNTFELLEDVIDYYFEKREESTNEKM